ncbi:MAG: glutamine--fructose-6-phosphate transaminase (isomerizing) [Candidatus Caldatribacteriaceae bacterium]
MCGIAGYVGQRSALPVLMQALKKLEYRGYDSAGIAIFEDDTLHIFRKKGKIRDLEQELVGKNLRACFGIGHTRWATHGIPSDQNAHPHCDCRKRVAVVHNGIIENYKILREKLIQEGHRFSSETDTEVIAHLLEEEGEPMKRLLRVVSLLEGSFALCVLFAEEEGVLYGVRQSSPLLLGIGEGEFFLSSDIPSFLEYTRSTVFLDDGEIIRVDQRGFTVFDFEGERREKSIVTIPWDPVSAEKGGFKHFMLKEIHEEPRVLEDTLVGRVNLSKQTIVLEELEDIVAFPFRRAVIVACGTACHAGMLGRIYLETLARLPVTVEYASEFRYKEPLLEDTLVIAVSQSGETADTIKAVELAKEKGSRVFALCNVLGSSLTRIADWVLYTRAGVEISVASTKAFLGQIVALLLFALFLGKKRGTLSTQKEKTILTELLSLSRKMNHILQEEDLIHSVACQYYRYQNFFYLGRGIFYPLALEGALKLKEVSYAYAEGLSAGEMKHGPIALVGPDLVSMVLLGEGEQRVKMLGNIEEIRARQGKLIAVALQEDEEARERVDFLIPIPRTTEILSPLVAIIPLQLFAYYMALERGCDVDQPRNLAKSVTVE